MQRLPSKSTVNTDSFLWDIQRFNEKTFCTYHKYTQVEGKTNTINGLRSPSFTLSFMRDGTLKEVSLYLWLTQDTTVDQDGSSTWLKLSLTESENWHHEYDECTRISPDSRNICIAWISGRQRECLSTLAGGAINVNPPPQLRGYRSTASSTTKMYFFSNPKFVLREELFDKRRGFMCGDRLSIVCEVHAFTNDTSLVHNWLFHPLKPPVVQNTEHTLTRDLKQILDSGENSDVKLVTSDGQGFPAHTFMLSSRSPVFAAMFKLDMKEKQENQVNIEDLSSKAVAGLLEFIYTDTVSDISAIAPELLSAADQYNIPRLLMLCEEAMAPELKITNAAEYFLLADIHGASQLRKAAKHFTATHFKAVKATDGWQILVDHSQQLGDEIVDELAEVMAQLMS